MEQIYISSAAFGLVLIIASTIGGGDGELDIDTEVDADIDLDIDADVDADIDIGDLESDLHADSGPAHFLPFLSIRFWTFALATFGVTGWILMMLGASAVVHIPVSIIMGFGLGMTAAWTYHKVKSIGTDSTSHLERLAGLEASVILPIRPGGTGKIRLAANGQELEIPATASHEETIAIDSRVLIVSVTDGTADVSVIPGS